jgi:Oxidoreductase family, NAD-binding Rossmann fold/Oxidoreductase family, C-terminal alpha/beta domain
VNDNRFSRRYFFYGSLLAGAVPAGGFGSTPSRSAPGFKSVIDKLNIAGIGIGGRGRDDIATVATSENIVALCDVNDDYAAPVFNRYPKATRYKDFRKMLDTEGKNIDAVIIGTPDHGHTPAALYAMQHGKHVYCEKPLARTVWEVRLLREAASKYKVATQMGNQGYSHEGTRTAAEILWSGDIGEVKEVHVWTSSAGPQDPSYYGNGPEVKDGRLGPGGIHILNDGSRTAASEEPVPPGLDWDLWLATAAARTYNHSTFKQWRAYSDFGTGGSLGDWLVHCLGPVHLALRLHEAPPTSVECLAVEGASKWTAATNSHIRYEFPTRGRMPAVTVHAYQNMRGDAPYPPGMAADEPLLPRSNNLAERGRPAPPEPTRERAPGANAATQAGRAGAAGAPGGRGPVDRQRVPGDGALFVGDKGYMATGGRGEGVWLLPASRWAEYKLPPQILPRSVSHQMDWVRACKGGLPACSNFDIAVPYIEWLVLGVAALHVPKTKLMWDAKAMRFNNEEANQYLRPYVRKGWELKL